MNLQYLDKLNKEQRKAATTVNGPLLIIAGAGSGKTTVLVNRLRYMIDMGINPASILLLTFTNAAAQNMLERASKIGNGECNETLACTYHSFCAKMLRQYGELINLDTNFSIITPSEVNDAIKFVKAENEKYRLRNFPSNAVVAGILSTSINKQLSIDITIQKEYSKYYCFTNEIKSLISDYKKYKEEKNLLDYDDLLLRMLELLSNSIVKEKINNRFQYIMVDEYQDTNKLQEKIVFLLCGVSNNIAVVGDDYQSIYAFRGSDINNILNFPSKFSNCKVVTIDTNYRSTKEIIDVANKVMDDYANFGFKKQMKTIKCNDKKVSVRRPKNADDEARDIFTLIQNQIKQNIPLSEIAVLERNSMSSSRLELLLENAGIPYKKLGGIKFMEHQCVLDILAYLKVITNPYDELSWFRVLDNIPGIGEAYGTKISKNCTNENFLLDKKYNHNFFYKYLVRLHNFIIKVKEELDFSVQLDELVNYYIDIIKTKIQNMKLSDEGDRTDYLNELENTTKPILQQLKEIALEEPDAVSFLDSLVLNATPNITDNDNCLTISTIHSAKGMEWNTVIIMDCVDEVFPKYTIEQNDKEDYSEELRCFYVALTRAKDNLYIYSPKSLINRGRHINGRISHFLNNCDDILSKEETNNIQDKKIYLHVPYSEKDEAKALGSRWDSKKRQWYITENLYTSAFMRWS